ALDSIGGYLSINDNATLQNFTGLDNLQTIGDYFEIYNNATLQNMEGLGSLHTVNSFVRISYNDNLTSLSGLSALDFIGGELNIHGNPALQNLLGLNSLHFVGDDIIIEDNISLQSLSGIENIDPATIIHLEITGNLSLSFCSVESICDYLYHLSGSHFIQNNNFGCNSSGEVVLSCGTLVDCYSKGITFSSQEEIDLFGLLSYEDCFEMSNDVIISEAEPGNITNLNGLIEIKNIQGKLKIESNESLPNLAGLDSLSFVGDNFEIINNNSLFSLSGLGNTHTISGKLKIENNDNLQNLTGLDSLHYIQGNLLIKNNQSLASIENLQNLDSIAGYLVVAYNPTLTSLHGLQNIAPQSIQSQIPVNPDIAIYQNPELSTCHVTSICEAIALPQTTTNIHSNAPGCASLYEVEVACPNIVIISTDTPKKQSLHVYPNPVHHTLTIQSSATQSIQLYNAYGIFIKTINLSEGQNTVDLSHLPQGLYLLTIQDGTSIKILKM
ncbi:MAG TPA: T9SS type A sorting domain-containing protein, partial [Phaeodactylibacter sp.]|nr:T9SS type A sorting domain-containing protein [Phaeodactylibacter sp.]